MNKTLTKALACVGALAIIGGSAIGLMEAFAPADANYKPSNWGHVNELPDTGDNGNNGENGGSLIEGGENHGIALMSEAIAVEDFEDYGISMQADSAYMITATLDPANAADTRVIWGVGYRNPESEWARNHPISECAEINATTEYGTTATLTIKQAFGEPIFAKAAYYLDSDIYGTSKVDYVKDVTSFTATLNPSISADWTARVYVADTINTVAITPNYGVGTVAGEITSVKTTFNVSSETKTRLQSISSGYSFTCASSLTFEGTSFTIPFLSFWSSGGGDKNAFNTIMNNHFYQYGSNDGGVPGHHWAEFSSVNYEITYTYEDSMKTLTASGGTLTINNTGLNKIVTVNSISTGGDIFVCPF